jgi:BASS family bile acid:Na+ symporter
MSLQDLIRLLVSITLIEMMVAIGLQVTAAELRAVARDRKLIARAAFANYVLVPAVTVALLLFFHAKPAVAAGFLILAACPGAPYGPPLTAIAKGDVAASVGLMALLAASSTLLAPLLLVALLPLVAGESRLAIDPARMVATLAVTQLLPLGTGLLIRYKRPAWADAARKPAKLIGTLLNITAVALILSANFDALSEIRPGALLGMLALLLASLAAGRLLGGPAADRRKAVTLTTSLRNVGLALVIASTAFGAAAVIAVLAYGLLEVHGSLALSLAWGYANRRDIRLSVRQAPTARSG